MYRLVINWFIILALVVGVVSADRGVIVPPHVYVREDTQVAIVAWDGSKEILMLSTNVWANKSAEVWEVIPLPSKPTIEKGEKEVFDKMVKIYNKNWLNSGKVWKLCWRDPLYLLYRKCKCFIVNRLELTI